MRIELLCLSITLGAFLGICQAVIDHNVAFFVTPSSITFNEVQ